MQLPTNSLQNWLLLLAYDGFHYYGWQIQSIHPTIEGELEKAIETLTGQSVDVCGAGRTDAKVHALNQTANFISSARFPAEKWRLALNAVTPDDIVVKHVLPVPSSFHARHSATGKRYRYLIHNKAFPTPFGSHYSWWVRYPLDLEAMRKAAKYLVGEHDFSAFRSSQCSAPSPVKYIRQISIHVMKSSMANLRIEVEANGFLQHMVRIIVGTLVEVGQNRRYPENVLELLRGKDRRKSGKTAPPYGLYVLEVLYEGHEIHWPAEALDG